MNLAELGLRGHTINELREAQIESAEDLTRVSRDFLLAKHGIGKKRLAEIEACLEKHGYTLAQKT